MKIPMSYARAVASHIKSKLIRNKMDEQTIIENNKLIGEFMEFKHYAYFPNTKNCFMKDNGDLIKYEDLKYHRDWNDLMLVVEKIESLEYKFQLCKKSVVLYPENDYTKLIKSTGNSKIDAVYQAVIAFIKYHNVSLIDKVNKL